MRASAIVLILLAFGCGAPASTTPGSEPPAPDSEEGQAGTPARGGGEATSPDAAIGAEITELARAETPSERLVGAVDTARLVRVGLRGYANRIVNRMRRVMARERRQWRGRRGVSPSSALGRRADALGTDEDASPEAEAPARRSAPVEDGGGDEGSVTNTQVAGVDEGGIVKAWRDYLVFLRRGRLFTVRLGDRPGTATPVAAIDVRPPGSQHDCWYDEMLLHAPTGTVIVVGFSYDHMATEIGRFQIANDGTLRHRATHLLRSNDYYSSRNYASRLIGDTLVFYMPHYLIDMEVEPVRVSLPSLRPFHGGAWRSILVSSEIYRITGEEGASTLHTVVQCDLSAPRLRCTARGIIGGEGRTFYVSRDAVYVWIDPVYDEWAGYIGDDDEEPDGPSHLFRLPLDGSRPSALEVRGAPVDQFSFHETGRDLWVLVRAEGGGDSMWAPELGSGAVGLARIPLSGFGRNVRELMPAAYRALPSPTTGGAMQNRFIGEYVLYGVGTTWGRRSVGGPHDDRVFLHRYDDGRSFALTLPNGVDRIEAMDDDAVVVGTDGRDLHFHAFDLGAAPTAGGHYVRVGAIQGETRSHGFFYRASGEGEGVLGLPTRSAQQSGVHQLVEGSADVLYLAVERLDFSELGSLASGGGQRRDRCEVSCVDWYGNARPLFYRGRVFALLGYELVEGRISGGAITEVARTNFLNALPPEED